jgi:hypothetical protein
MRVGIMRMFIMGVVNILGVGLMVLTLDELCQCVELVLEGLLELLVEGDHGLIQ